MWGVTRNPWNLNCSPVGSSGGGTASLAAGTRLELTLTTYQTEAAQRLAEVIQKMLSDVGVATTIQPLDKPTYDSALEAEEVEIALRVYTWDNADILPWFIHSQYIPAPNYTGVNDTDLDTCMDDADYKSATWAIRDEKYVVCQQYIIDTHYPWAPVYQEPALWFARDTVLDITAIPLRAGMSTELWTLIDLVVE
jgi:ABC-type oligopeptide transport system substrate-binding subunit